MSRINYIGSIRLEESHCQLGGYVGVSVPAFQREHVTSLPTVASTKMKSNLFMLHESRHMAETSRDTPLL